VWVIACSSSPAIAKTVANRLLQRVELVAQAHHLAVSQLGAVALDDALGFFGLAGMHREANVAEAIDRQRKNRLRDVG
jgi:hypothetical protein